MVANVKKSSGFTLVELMIVMAIIGILMAIGTYYWRTTQGRARDLQAMNDANILLTMLVEAYNDKKNVDFDGSLDVPAQGWIGDPQFYKLSKGVGAMITPGSSCNGEDPGYFEAEFWHFQGTTGDDGEMRSYMIYIDESENIMEKTF